MLMMKWYDHREPGLLYFSSYMFVQTLIRGVQDPCQPLVTEISSKTWLSVWIRCSIYIILFSNFFTMPLVYPIYRLIQNSNLLWSLYWHELMIRRWKLKFDPYRLGRRAWLFISFWKVIYYVHDFRLKVYFDRPWTLVRSRYSHCTSNIWLN